MKKKILLFIGLAGLLVFLTGCVFIKEGNSFCGVCPVAPLMAFGILIISNK